MYERIKVNTLLGYENVLDIYTIDKYGNCYGKNGMELSQGVNSKGYSQLKLKIKNERKWKHALIHRLVGLAFVDGRTEELNEIDHIDGNKKNNYYANLRWTNRKGNMSNSVTKEKLLAGKNGTTCYVYDFLLNFIGEFNSLNQASLALNRTFSYINSRVKDYYVLDSQDLSKILAINKKQNLTSIVITDIETHEKIYFYSNREARRFFDNKVNITQAIQKNWTVRGKYKVRNLNYKKLISMLDL